MLRRKCRLDRASREIAGLLHRLFASLSLSGLFNLSEPLDLVVAILPRVTMIGRCRMGVGSKESPPPLFGPGYNLYMGNSPEPCYEGQLISCNDLQHGCLKLVSVLFFHLLSPSSTSPWFLYWFWLVFC